MQDGIAWSSDLLATAQRFGPRVAVTDGVAQLTFATLAARAHGLAHHLLAIAATPAEPIASLMPNGPDAVITSYAITIAGFAEVPINVAATDAELGWYATLAKFRRIVAPRDQADRLRALGLDAIAAEDGGESTTPLPPVPTDSWGRLAFTSGTTGRPKAIVHSHGGRWIAHLLQRAVMPFAPQPGDRILLMTPFPHGASLLTYAWLEAGGEVMLLPGVVGERIAPLLETNALSAIFAPPTVLAKILSLFPRRQFAGVRTIFCGTQALLPDLHARATAAFGPVVRVTYGMSECFNPITILPPDQVADAMAETDGTSGACVGSPGPSVEITIDPETTEISLRARQLYAGIITADGYTPRPPGAFHRTGDLGRIDPQGRLWLMGRAADVIKTGGYRVHPAEIETVLEPAAQGRALAIVTLPSEYWGEVIVCVAEDAPVGWEADAIALAAQLAKYKRPRAYLTFAALPRNAQGKLVRARLREAILQTHSLEDGPHPRLNAMPGA
ncbi:class I adenylate-forming enzyme family protein [Plastoroseomonas arctica]|uniref:Acyl--CoA ligase n=1 Tax=Plastoroseomonas arctica TaxID=1509237 RepID=A0AAF1K5P3_9PROT|nr:class I adenylate-forming enzyme family protein [Plastoroseomonas arctica]MBR0657048.1 acyl--CoA ligase [Plastoroseomonas arctica]